MGFVRSAIRVVSSIFSPEVPQMQQPVLPAAPVSNLTATRPASPTSQAQRDSTQTDRRIAAVQGQPNLTSVLATGDAEETNTTRARRKALGI